MICIWHSLVPLRKREKKLWIELESITRLTSIVVMKTSIQIIFGVKSTKKNHVRKNIIYLNGSSKRDLRAFILSF